MSKNNKIMNIRKRNIINIFGTILGILLLATGCNSVITYTPIAYHEDGYQSFIGDQGSLKFSFKYPSCYHVMYYEYVPKVPTTDVGLSEFPWSDITVTQSPFEPSLNITTNVFNKETRTKDITINILSGPIDPKIEIENLVSFRKNTMKDFELREKSRVVFGDLEGWESTVYYISPAVNLPDVPYRDARPLVIRDLFIGGLRPWHLVSITDSSLNLEAKIDFEYIIETFKFLN